jgi:hypothetical protein
MVVYDEMLGGKLFSKEYSQVLCLETRVECTLHH